MTNKFKNILTFIRELYNQKEGFLPLYVPTLKGNEKKYLNDCIDSTFVSSVGKYVDLFEEKIEQYTGAKKAIVCVNGTNALHICLELVGVKQNDEVLTQALTFIATANAISYAKAIPLFIDVDKDTMGLSPKAMLKYLEENAEVIDGQCYNKTTKRRIKACMPMHTFGHACRIEEIAKICEQYHIELVEDAAEAMGATYNGKHLGLFGKIAAISFNGNKTITTGGGGVIITNDVTLAKRAKHITTQAKIPHPWEYTHDEIGYNYRMPNINAALGVAQLEQIGFFIKNKRETAQQYIDFFKGKDIQFFTERENTKANYWLNAIILNNRDERDAFLKYSNENGIMTRPIWTLMNKMPMFKNCPKGVLTNSQWLEDRVVNVTSSVRS